MYTPSLLKRRTQFRARQCRRQRIITNRDRLLRIIDIHTAARHRSHNDGNGLIAAHRRPRHQIFTSAHFTRPKRHGILSNADRQMIGHRIFDHFQQLRPVLRTDRELVQ